MAEPAAPTTHAPDGVNALLAPAQVSAIPTTVAAAVPVLVKTRYGPLVGKLVAQVKVEVPPLVTKLEAGSVTVVTAIWAVWDAEPKIPKTKPPIATAAIRVTAMISTVAMIGEMALLHLEKMEPEPSFEDCLEIKRSHLLEGAGVQYFCAIGEGDNALHCLSRHSSYRYGRCSGEVDVCCRGG